MRVPGWIFFILLGAGGVRLLAAESPEAKLVVMINEIRSENGLAPLQALEDLKRMAAAHSKSMASGATDFGHDGFSSRYAEVRKRIPETQKFGENVAYDFSQGLDLEGVVKQWMASPAHRKNILGDYSWTGVGIAASKDGEKRYFTQVFVATPSIIKRALPLD
jgi:uncharacterized protein YkwD